MPKVSVIVPIYGVEMFIKRCAESLFNQTMDDIEFIFVNDCTKDNSINILNTCIDLYPEINNRIKIINHNENKGLPQARKTGFENSTGEFITYCDSDDWVDRDIYRQMYDKAITENADIVICGYAISDGKFNKTQEIAEKTGLLMGPVWNKLVKRSLYANDIEFPTANKAEDGAIMTQISYYSQRRAYIHKPLYYYFSNPMSICGQIDEKSCITKMQQECDNVNLRLDFLNRNGCISKYSKDIISWKFEARNNLIPCISHRHIYDLWNIIYPEIGSQIIMSGNIRMLVKYLLLKFRLHRLIKYLK